MLQFGLKSKQNRLTMGMLISKLPLIFIVVSQKLYSEMQIGLRESKYWVTSNPYLQVT